MDICKDINKEHGESQPKAQADDDKMGTPSPAHDDKMGTPEPLEQEIRGKRKVRLAAAYRSPYVRRARTWEVIDNIRHAKAANNVYTAKLRRLKKHFTKYLNEKEQSWFASSIIRMKTIYLTMPWQTLQNNTDYGVFLMRHMETYKRDTKN
ncbi:hypothetical protein POM88_011474 [Heracleum sosnowskyi]|uniref:Uncharacterized protein n=1 Tax=Heracleum sosnowskyi TaxID=360622 RepID=A0AAD8N2F9_9APIA|nr:hypothetical protein POM88_011474 [Heracleum sosnowskyi]